MLLQILTLLGSLAMFLYGMSLMSGGLLALGSAIAVIMGANIGTTVTAWIFALSFGGGSWSIGTVAIPHIPPWTTTFPRP